MCVCVCVCVSDGKVYDAYVVYPRECVCESVRVSVCVFEVSQYRFCPIRQMTLPWYFLISMQAKPNLFRPDHGAPTSDPSLALPPLPGGCRGDTMAME